MRDATERAAARTGSLEAADIRAGVALARGKDHPVMPAVITMGEVGSWQALLAMSAGTLAWGLLTRDRALAETGGRMLAAGTLASLVKTSLKRTLHRTRPNVLMDTGRYARGPFGPNDGPWQSFPSGHAALSVAVARAVARARPGLSGPAYATAAGVVAVQLVRGAHFPADVAAGALIGLAAEAATDRLVSARLPQRAEQAP
ncbi:phosphatase PAP2 family protein [Methylobacterium sp. Leaf118]|uniref:phosphatase PAP2 family protein n=1 Tax=Methylobacterium sp. Leaf118 TaxID=2876562 RepID=UPI001E63FBE7|nr:phosphatase PAP2 family protein [Methylobacterium sp. Leaf118]